MKYEVLYDRVLAVPLEPKAGRIIIPDKSKEHWARNNGKGEQARVVMVGSGLNRLTGKKVKLDVRVGDTIVLNSFTRAPVRIGGIEYIILRERDVLAVIE